MSSDVQVVAKESLRFDISNEAGARAMLQHLDEFGYTVVTKVADKENIDVTKKMFWDFWEKEEFRGPLNRNDTKTWNNWMANGATGILINSRGANHNDFLWSARTLPKVKESFVKIWDDDELIVSYDAGGVFRPWSQNIHWLTNGGWWHVDQNWTKGEHRQGRVTVQGLVTYYDATAETGGLCVIPKSHTHHEEVCKRAPSARMKHDYVSVQRDDPVLQTEQAVLVCARAGDLILWDSRTVHCNTPALHMADYFSKKLQAASDTNTCTSTGSSTAAKGGDDDSDATAGDAAADKAHTALPATAPTPTLNPLTSDNVVQEVRTEADLLRLVAYVCMVPRSHASEEILQKRKTAFCHRIATSHYPTYDIELLPPEKELPWTKRRDILKLVGYTEGEIKKISAGLDPNEAPSSSCSIS